MSDEAMANRGEQRTICEACGNSNLAHGRAIWTDDGSAFCPECAVNPPKDNVAPNPPLNNDTTHGGDNE